MKKYSVQKLYNTYSTDNINNIFDQNILENVSEMRIHGGLF